MAIITIAGAGLLIETTMLKIIKINNTMNKFSPTAGGIFSIKLDTHREKEPRIAVLIPARDESKVIEGLLRSIQRQSYPVLGIVSIIELPNRRQRSDFVMSQILPN